MSRYAFQLPDLGEGTVSAEIVTWLVKPGDSVSEGQPIAEMSTEKAVVELPSPVTGKVISLAGAPGDAIAVGAELIAFEAGGGSASASAAPSVATEPSKPPAARPTEDATHVRASPATRRRAREAGIDLAKVAGSGPRGRIQPDDLNQALAAKAQPGSPEASGTEEIKVIGVRR